LEVVDLHQEYWENVAAYAIDKIRQGLTCLVFHRVFRCTQPSFTVALQGGGIMTGCRKVEVSATARKYGLSLEVVDLHQEYWENVAAYAIDKIRQSICARKSVWSFTGSFAVPNQVLPLRCKVVA